MPTPFVLITTALPLPDVHAWQYVVQADHARTSFLVRDEEVRDAAHRSALIAERTAAALPLLVDIWAFGPEPRAGADDARPPAARHWRPPMMLIALIGLLGICLAQDYLIRQERTRTIAADNNTVRALALVVPLTQQLEALTRTVVACREELAQTRSGVRWARLD